MENETYSVLIRTCKRCKETLPLAEFRYKLTRAQMKAQGFAGNVLVTAEGKVCKYCRPRKKPLSKLTRKELVTKASSGDIHPLIAKSIIAERKVSRRAKQKAGRYEGWVKHWKAEHKRVLSGLPIEIHRVTGQARHALASRHMDRHKFFLMYLGELKRLKARLFLEFRAKPAEPKFNCWQEYADMDAQIAIRTAWEALPLADRVPLKVPALIRHRFDPLVNAYTRPTRASPAERIARGG
jgi:hypothetical protein